MRRILSEIATYFAELTQSARAGWNRFFFTPADPTSLGLIRIAVGLLAFWNLLVFGIDLPDFFGSYGWAGPEEIRMAQRPLAWSFWFQVPDGGLRLVWCLCLVVFALYTLGVCSRVMMILGWVIVVSTVRRVPIALFGFDQVLSTLALYLAATGAAGQAVSLDRFWHRWRQARAVARAPGKPGRDGGRRVSPGVAGAPAATVSANLALRLIRVHLVVIYGMAGIAKLHGPSWWTGTALWGTMAAGEFTALDFTPLAAWPLVINLLTHASLTLELLYPVMIWIRIVRPLWLAGVLAMHVGIAVISPGLTEFALAMVAGNLAFVSGQWWRRLATGADQPAVKVLFDGACPRCRATMATLAAADPDRVIDPIDLTAVSVATIHPALTRADCMRSMHVVSRGGQITSGFDGVRLVASWLPLFWPFAAVCFLPGIASPGRRVYNWLAATRPRDVPCTDDVCGLHSRPVHAKSASPEHARD